MTHETSTFAALGRLVDRWIDGTLDRAFARHAARLARPGKPGPFQIIVFGQRGLSMLLEATLPAKTADDVVGYELTYTIDGGPPVVVNSAGEPIHFSAAEGSTVVATFVLIDDAGNRSEPGDPVTLVVEDRIAPGRPGVFNLSVVGEEPMAGPDEGEGDEPGPVA